MVDVSYSHAVAPGSSIRIYLGNQKHTSASAILDAIHAAVTEKNNPCGAISISFSFCGGSKGFYKTQSGFFAQAASQGQSVFVATGDDGAAGLKLKSKGVCVTGTSRNINELAASPNVTAIGGTEFAPNYSGGDDVGSVPETVWNDGDGAAGGGESKVFNKPTFQKGLIKKDKKRDVPDISFAASPSTPGFFYGGRDIHNAPAVVCCIGGTSLGAPAWAGISQLISQAHGLAVGNLDTRIYQLGAKANAATTGIRDVTSGNTNFNGVTGFSATTGYDKASGWGQSTSAFSSAPIWGRNSLSALRSPRSNSGKTGRRDSGDKTRDVAHRRGRKVSLRPQINFREALQQRHRSAFGDASVAVSNSIFAHPLSAGLITEKGQRDSRITPDVLDLVMHRQMADHELLPFNSDPHHGDLRTAVPIERGQMSVRSFVDHFAQRLRNFHVCFSAGLKDF